MVVQHLLHYTALKVLFLSPDLFTIFLYIFFIILYKLKLVIDAINRFDTTDIY